MFTWIYSRSKHSPPCLFLIAIIGYVLITPFTVDFVFAPSSFSTWISFLIICYDTKTFSEWSIQNSLSIPGILQNPTILVAPIPWLSLRFNVRKQDIIAFLISDILLCSQPAFSILWIQLLIYFHAKIIYPNNSSDPFFPTLIHTCLSLQELGDELPFKWKSLSIG